MDLEARKDKFIEKYGEIRDECKIDIYALPVYVPDGQGGFKTVLRQTLVDLETMSVPSTPEAFL